MHISGLYIGLALLLVLILAARVMWLRTSRQVPLGDGGIAELGRAIRAHGNAVEYLPLGLLGLLLLELDQLRPPYLHLLGASLLLGRLLHAWGLSRRAGNSFGRGAGIALTWLSMLAIGLLLLGRYLLGLSLAG